MIDNILRIAGKVPACHCALCAQRRALRLAQALQQKYSPAPVID